MVRDPRQALTIVALAFAAHAVARRRAPAGLAARGARAALVRDRLRRVRCLHRRALLPAGVAVDVIRADGRISRLMRPSRRCEDVVSIHAVDCVRMRPRAGRAQRGQAGRSWSCSSSWTRCAADYPVRYAALLQHGLKRLTTQGAWYTNAAYPVSQHPDLRRAHHDRHRNAALSPRDDRQRVVRPRDAEGRDLQRRSGLGSQLRHAFSGPGDSAKSYDDADAGRSRCGSTLKSRVATMAMKARSAIGLAGHEGDFVTWFGDRLAWETSTAFAKAPGRLVRRLPEGQPAHAGQRQGVGAHAPGRTLPGRGRCAGRAPAARLECEVSPSPGPAGDAAYYPHWLQSPFADDYLGEMAAAAVDQMHLGTEDRTDFLGVSFAMLDTVGHSFGPRSHEVQDVLVRLDATIGKLLDHLDKTVGAGNYVVALTADHGVGDIPEQVTGGGRLPITAVRTTMEAAVKTALGGDGPFDVVVIYQRRLLQAGRLRAAEGQASGAEIGARQRERAAGNRARPHAGRDLDCRGTNVQRSAGSRRGAELLRRTQRRSDADPERELA